MSERFTAFYRFYKSTNSQDFRTKEDAVADMERSTLEGRCYALCVYDKQTRRIVWITSTETLESILPYLPGDIVDPETVG